MAQPAGTVNDRGRQNDAAGDPSKTDARHARLAYAGRVARTGVSFEGRAGNQAALGAHRRGRNGLSTVSENFTMACRRCQSFRVNSMVFEESMAKTSSICRATAGLKTSMLIS